jgi:AcrR family transcriptional regulator
MRVTLTSAEAPDGRARRRIAAMRRVQEAALELFEARGFAAVTIEEIAAAAEVGPATVYRHFGTKERIVLWDDYDPELFREIAERLPGRPVLDAVLDGLIAALGPVYARDGARILRRSRLAFAIPAVAAVAAADLRALRQGLAELFVTRRAARAGLEADVLAAAVTGTLEVALAHWVHADGKPALATIFRRAFRHLAEAPARR